MRWVGANYGEIAVADSAMAVAQDVARHTVGFNLPPDAQLADAPEELHIASDVATNVPLDGIAGPDAQSLTSYDTLKKVRSPAWPRFLVGKTSRSVVDACLTLFRHWSSHPAGLML